MAPSTTTSAKTPVSTTGGKGPAKAPATKAVKGKPSIADDGKKKKKKKKTRKET